MFLYLCFKWLQKGMFIGQVAAALIDEKMLFDGLKLTR